MTCPHRVALPVCAAFALELMGCPMASPSKWPLSQTLVCEVAPLARIHEAICGTLRFSNLMPHPPNSCGHVFLKHASHAALDQGMANRDPRIESTNTCLCKHSLATRDPVVCGCSVSCFIGDVWPVNLDWVLSAPLLSSWPRRTSGAQQTLTKGSETQVGFCATSSPGCLTWPHTHLHGLPWHMQLRRGDS